MNPAKNVDISPTKSFQGHTGPINDLCQIFIGKFNLLLTASSDLSVRVCSQSFLLRCHWLTRSEKLITSDFSCGISSLENVYVHFYLLMKFILYVRRHFRRRCFVEQILVQFLLFRYEH